MLRYSIRLKKDDNGTLLVTAPDFPEIVTFGIDEADAMIRAADAIASAIQGRISDRESVPAPSPFGRRQKCVSLSALVWAKLELYRVMLATKTRKADLARRLGVHAPQIDRLLNLDHDSRLDQIENAARAMNRELYIEMRPAA
ncbi:antitoxin HicB [Variibacter gotjawalensis]|uniref:Antitoxin HicB n=1 Tax=Variibacter gotjawalensis TaxID=1333996 RepID=A0A0S3PZ08_9BRAD|nr:type II toxin-antitoxin system HicB family antitoxin [Variibacter gotjawalensis]RZS48890.1 antitoxin HicB [Variibacter gotjawalensis]BAT61149.1 antitoxin HicB [Variibacter gotjawalensis]